MQVCAPVIDKWLILWLHAEHLLQLTLHASRLGMIEANDLAATEVIGFNMMI